MEPNKMPKPLSVAKHEFVNGLTELINSSGLPYFVVEYALKDITRQVEDLALAQLKNDIRMYNATAKQNDETCPDVERSDT